ncbi:AAA family ATPase [Brachybacterium sp. GCM10030267]|uniref:AAA family ATPase n=1 Tax=unclassified Brachybacterium TaxID=2623841 RepID=UPI003619FCD2
MDSNPFTPGFGLTPRVLAMQGSPLEDFGEALAGRRSVGERSVLISGARGVGKTVLLTQMHDVADLAGWRTIILHTSSTSMVEELRGATVDLLRETDPEAESIRPTSATVGAFGARAGAGGELIDRYDGEAVPLGRLLERLAELLTEEGGGLVVSIDEVQSADRDQLHEIAQHMQDLIGRGYAVGFVAAGIRAGVDELLAHPRTTFLRRAHKVEVGSVDEGTAAEVIRLTVSDTAKSITPEAAVRAGQISRGYPYLMQVVGSHAWQRSGEADVIEIEDVEGAREPTIDAMIYNVHGPALRDITGRKLEYLYAMIEDEGPSQVSEIAARMGLNVNNQNVHRSRLIREELIQPAGRGAVEYAMPYLREALLRLRETGTSSRAAGPARVARPVRHQSGRRGES